MGIVITKEVLKSVIDFVPYSNRTALLKLLAKPNDLNIILVYPPTADSPHQDVKQFHEVKELIKRRFQCQEGKDEFEEISGNIWDLWSWNKE